MIPGGHDIIDQVIQRAALLSVPLYRQQVIKWIKELKRLDRESELENLTRIAPKLQSLYYQAIMAAYLTGAAQAQTEIAFQDGTVHQAELLRFAEPDSVKIVTDILSKFPAAEKAFLMKNAVDYASYKRISGYAKDLAFSLARVEEQGAIEMVKKSLDDSFVDGQTFREWRKGVNQVFEKGGWTPLSPWHAENVFRTNLMSVYAAGKYEFCQAADNVVAYEYSTVGDSRVRDAHAAMNGKIFAKDNPIWNRWMPPNGYGCRCTFIPITKAYAEANGLKFNTRLPKGAGAGDPNFAGLPTLDNYLETLRYPNETPEHRANRLAKRKARLERKKAGLVGKTPKPAPAPKVPGAEMTAKMKAWRAKLNATGLADLDSLKDLNAVESWARKNVGIHGLYSAGKPVPLDSFKQVVAELYELKQKYNCRNIAIYWNEGTMKDNVWASVQAGQDRLNINAIYFNNISKFERDIRLSKAAGWHPPNTRGAAIKNVIDHEFTHLLTSIDIERFRGFGFELSRIQAAYIKEMGDRSGAVAMKDPNFISRYAVVETKKRPGPSLDEFAAEAFEDYLNNPNAGIYSQAVGSLIERYYGRKK